MKLTDIYKRFDGKQVLAGFSCEFPEGETTCILGISGGGKTTLLRIMMGLIQPDSGEISGMQGKRISAVFQEDRLCMGFTASANIRLVNQSLSKEEAGKMLAEAGLPNGSLPVRDFSGGMRRRVAILRALAAEYDILFLDEPFRGLDEETRMKMMIYLQESAKGKTVICVTHDEDEAKFLGTAPFVRIPEFISKTLSHKISISSLL